MDKRDLIMIQPINKTLKGEELDSFFGKQIVDLEEEYVRFLSQFDATDLFHKWREFIRHIDELYNITSLTTPDEDEIIESCSLNICKDPLFGQVVEIVGRRYGNAVQCRFIKTCLMLSALNYAYISTDQFYNCCRSLREAIDRCQKMRLYYVTMLLFIPKYAKGSKKIDFKDLLNVFQPQIDMCLVNIRTAFNALMVNKCIEGYKAESHPFGLAFNFSFDHLESESLEPERLSIVDVMENMTDEEKKALPHFGVHQLYGYDEMMEGIVLSSAVFNKYGLNESDEYREMVSMAHDLKEFLRDDYSFIVPQDSFNKMQEKYPHLSLFCDKDDFDDMLNACPAFFEFDGIYYSSVLFYQRYMENRTQRILEKKKKFQIDSGFAFEKKIKEVLNCFGYEVKDGIKRIKRKEFDVICIKNGCIYNFQCKNNYLTISQQGKGWFDFTCSAIRRLNRYYEYALQKEDKRDYLLKEKLGVETVKSFVISRFPVITRNSRIINYNQLTTWLYSQQ